MVQTATRVVARRGYGMRRSCKIGISFSNDLFILAILSVAIYKANTFSSTHTNSRHALALAARTAKKNK